MSINSGPEELQKYEWSEWKTSNSRLVGGEQSCGVAKDKECSEISIANVPKA